MNCKRNQKKLHLYRTGELSGRQAKSLERHLERCPSCASMRDEVARMEAAVNRMRDDIPKLEHPETISGRIMEAISGLEKGSRRAGSSASLSPVAQDDGTDPKLKPGLYERFMPGRPRNARRIRFGLAMAAAAIVAVFFIQESLVLSKISRLEERLAIASVNPVASQPMRSGIPLTMESIRNIPEAAVGAAASGEEWVTVRRSDVETLLRSVQDSRRFNGLLLQIIQKQYPAIRRLDEEMSLDSEKVIRILRENPSLIRQFLQSSITGGRT